MSSPVPCDGIVAGLAVASDFSIEAALETELDEKGKALDRALRRLAEEKLKNARLYDAVYQAAFDSSKALRLKPVTPPAKDRRRKAEETAVAVLSDWQLAKVTPTYSSTVCEERIERYAEKVIDLVEIQRADHPVRELRVWLLGDIVEGELIFPGQQHLIDSSLYTQVTVDGPRILGNFLRRMLANFDKVHVVGVIGNHGALGGRSRRDYNPESNADRMLYRIMQQILVGEKRLTWIIPDGDRERHWYAVDTIGSLSTLLIHGDQIRGGFAGFPWYGLAKKGWGWATGAVPEHFDEIAFGHYHQPTRMTLNRITARCNGSTESTNTYAMEQLAAVGRPSQWLLFAHPERGITAEYCVWLDEGEK